MASISPYPSGSDIIAPLPLYTPDFSAINTMMQKRAAMFEQGLSQVKSSDSLIRNAALSVSDNQVVRDQYIKQAEEQLKKLQGADFSQNQNVEAAQKVYAPFWQDEELLQDYSKTTAINSERTRAESMAQSNDPKQREQYWKTGLDYVNLSAGELSMAKRGDGSISKVKVNKYVPFFDVMGELKQRAKDQGLKIEEDSQGGPNMMYKITRTNGDKAVPLFKEWAENELSTMPQANDIFRVQGTVDFRSQVQYAMSMGYDEEGAKRFVAEKSIAQQASYLNDRYANVSDAVQAMQTELDAMDIANRALQEKGALPQEKLDARKALASQLEQTRTAASNLETSLKKYQDPNSKSYQDQLGAILSGGEDFFARYHKNALIGSFAKNQALNSTVKIDIDPVAKVNLEMEKTMAKMLQDDAQFRVRYGDGSPGSGGSSSSGGKKKDESNPLDNPVYMGKTILGNDPIEAQNRLKEFYNNIGTEYLNAGTSIINEAGMMAPDKMISPAYQNYLKQVMLTGKYDKPSPELLEEHKKLQEAGVINKALAFGEAPSVVYNNLYNRAITIIRSAAGVGAVNPNLFKRMQLHDRSAEKFLALKELNGEVEQAVTKDPLFKNLVKDGKIMTLGSFMREKLGYNSKDAFMKAVAYAPLSETERITNANTYGNVARSKALQAESQWDELEEQYNKSMSLVKGKTAKMMQRYIGVEGAVIGQTIRLSTDLKEDREIAQNMGLQVMSTTNLANQIVDKDGSGYPVNIAQLEKNGASKEKIKELIDLTRSNIDNMMSGVEMTKVGITGKPSVKIMYNIEELKKFLGEKKFNSEEWQGTIQALSTGLEFAVDQAQIDNFNQDFDLPGAADVNFDKNQMLKAPRSVKTFGFDYTILKDPGSNQYIINFQYNDQGSPRQMFMYSPLEKSLTSVQQMLEDKMYQIYTVNQQALRGSAGSGNFISPKANYDDLIRQ